MDFEAQGDGRYRGKDSTMVAKEGGGEDPSWSLSTEGQHG